MFDHHASTDINRPVEVVFDYMLQWANYSQLVETTVDARLDTDGPVGLGTRMTEVVKFGPGQFELNWAITAFEPNRLCAYEADYPYGKTKVIYSYKAIDQDARVTVEVQLELKSLVRLVEPVSRYFALRQRRQYLQNIKNTLETGEPVQGQSQ